jgi:hypothetical protein
MELKFILLTIGMLLMISSTGFARNKVIILKKNLSSFELIKKINFLAKIPQ